MECILETKAGTILEFVRGLQGDLLRLPTRGTIPVTQTSALLALPRLAIRHAESSTASGSSFRLQIGAEVYESLKSLCPPGESTAFRWYMCNASPNLEC
jgi:hypothetical protein